MPNPDILVVGVIVAEGEVDVAVSFGNLDRMLYYAEGICDGASLFGGSATVYHEGNEDDWPERLDGQIRELIKGHLSFNGRNADVQPADLPGEVLPLRDGSASAGWPHPR